VISLDQRPSHRALDIAVGLLLLYTTALGLREAASRPFWFDEVFTVLLARLPAFGDVLRALADATDTSGPMFYVFERTAARAHPDLELAYRLPSILASNLACALVYVIARRDLGPIPACVAVLVLLMSQLYHGYAVEARPYALMVLCITLAIAAWQRAAKWPGALVLGATSLVAVLTHYYSVFALAAFVAAEITHTGRRHRVRPRVWLALGVGAFALMVSWPFLSSLRSYYGSHYWSNPTLAKTLASYDNLLSFGPPGAGFGVAVALGLGLSLLAVRSWAREDDDGKPRPTPEMLVLILALLAVPVTVAVTARVMQGGFTDRYAICVLPGFALGAAYVIWALERRAQVWLLVACLSAFASHEPTFWASSDGDHGLASRARTRAMQELLTKAAGMDLPVVVGNGLEFLPLAFYGTGGSDIPLVAIADVEGARRYTGTDSIDLDLMALRRHVDVQVEDFPSFSRQHRTFLLMAASGPDNWWPGRLVHDGYVLTVIAGTTSCTLYRVEAPRAPAETR
jgi:hypothetical protein